MTSKICQFSRISEIESIGYASGVVLKRQPPHGDTGLGWHDDKCYIIILFDTYKCYIIGTTLPTNCSLKLKKILSVKFFLKNSKRLKLINILLI